MDMQLYSQQLAQINETLKHCPEGSEKEELQSLKENIEELLSLTAETNQEPENVKSTDPIDEEYAAFMAEIEEVEAADQKTNNQVDSGTFKDVEGKKFRAPFKHQWGQTVYHNAMVCSVPSATSFSEEFEVRVLFLNPTHQEMLPCPYYFDIEKDCKFSEEKCRFSHGEMVPYSSLQEYIEPKFDLLTMGSWVLAKRDNNLWYRARIKYILKDKCIVKFESKGHKDEEVDFEHIYPLESEGNGSEIESENEEVLHIENDEVINMSLMNTPTEKVLGDWEKHTKGIGSKLMQKMGYIVGTGLGKDSKGIINPVSAVILPPGKSLDYCMKLKQKFGGDKNLFSAERKLKRLQRKQKIANEKAYKKKNSRKDVFSFINDTLKAISQPETEENDQKSNFRQSLKAESGKQLNVAGFVIHENIKKCEQFIEEHKERLTKHKDVNSHAHKRLVDKILSKQDHLKMLKARAVSIKNEQQLRSDKKKMTIF